MKPTLILLALAFGVWAQGPSLAVEADTYGQYVWRGLLITNGPVLQTSTTGGYRGFHLNIFTNTDLNRANQRCGEVSELDFDAGYDRTREKLTVSGGVIHYTFPHTPSPSTTELYGGASLAVPLHPSIKVYGDVGSINGVYSTFDVSHSRVLAKPRLEKVLGAEWTAGFGAGSSGYNRGYFGVDRAALVDFHASLATPLALGRHLRLAPRVGYASVLDSTLRQSGVAKPHNFYWGFSLSWGL